MSVCVCVCVCVKREKGGGGGRGLRKYHINDIILLCCCFNAIKF